MAALLSLFNKPTIAWDFHSLMLGVQMMFSLMLSDTEKPIRICKHCLQTFMASRPRAIFGNPQCKNNRIKMSIKAANCPKFQLVQILHKLRITKNPKD